MADLDIYQAAQPVVLVGGSENAFIGTSATNDLCTNDLSNNSGIQGALNVGTSAVAARVGANNLANRKSLTAYNNSASIIYWGYTNAVTTSNGTPIQKGQLAAWDVGPNTTIFLIAGSATNDVRVTESA